MSFAALVNPLKCSGVISKCSVPSRSNLHSLALVLEVKHLALALDVKCLASEVKFLVLA